MTIRRRLALYAVLCSLPAGGAVAHGDLSERISGIRVRMVQHPDDGALQFELASLLFQEERHADALTVLDRLDQLAPGKYFTDHLRGSVLLALGRPGEARTAFDRFLKRDPGNAASMILRARALTELGLKEEALAEYRGLFKKSSAPEPDLIQEVAAALGGAGLPREALAILDQGMKITGVVPSLATRALELELSINEFDAALGRVDSLQKNAPRPEQWMARRAEILTNAGRIAESRAAWQALVEHLAALPAAVRGSHAMCRLAEQAHEGLRALQGLAAIPAATPASEKSLPPATP